MDRNRRSFLRTLTLAPTAALGDTRARAEGTSEPVELVAGPVAPGTEPRGQLAYESTPPGPILRVKRGVPVHLRLTNRLEEPTSLELHGMRVGAALNGIGGLADTALAPSSIANITVTPPDSGTFWFHPGPLHGIADQTARGLAGVFIVDEDDGPQVDADKTLMFTDRAPSGAVVASAMTPQAGLPALLLPNGKAWPDAERYAPGSRIRLRIVNASTPRAIGIACQGARPMVIAVDGQPSDLFEPLRDRVPVAPGARFDLMFDMPPAGTDVRFAVSGPDPGTDRDARAEALVLSSAGEPRRPRPPITPLPPNPLLPRMIHLENASRPALTVQPQTASPGKTTWTVNGVALSEGLPKHPLFSLARDTPVTLAFKNAGSALTGFRLHGHVMRLLHPLDDGWEPYWRDSVLVGPGVTHHAAFVADNPGRWLIDSPFADQASAGLRTWFEVR